MSTASRGNPPHRLPSAPLRPRRPGPLASTLRDVLGCLGVIVAAVLVSLLCVLLSQAFPQLAEISP
ncbi:hypothetical protein C3486_34050 [Streptomyces sp. Ru73]|uniref:hypothetical protein n=1 Tax=Streptomyces sp. Ru73 TaxID=2080748 RepID=UPI000CDD88DE|nr:hypothetical protein [Streptomyces sp. Ru73]POX36364.1 hypothetical protein C3486_34050 [Streptomyces sp. Ru73]